MQLWVIIRTPSEGQEGRHHQAFVNWGSLHARLRGPLQGMELQEKETQKD